MFQTTNQFSIFARGEDCCVLLIDHYLSFLFHISLTYFVELLLPRCKDLRLGANLQRPSAAALAFLAIDWSSLSSSCEKKHCHCRLVTLGKRGNLEHHPTVYLCKSFIHHLSSIIFLAYDNSGHFWAKHGKTVSKAFSKQPETRPSWPFSPLPQILTNDALVKLSWPHGMLPWPPALHGIWVKT